MCQILLLLFLWFGWGAALREQPTCRPLGHLVVSRVLRGWCATVKWRSPEVLLSRSFDRSVPMVMDVVGHYVNYCWTIFSPEIPAATHYLFWLLATWPDCITGGVPVVGFAGSCRNSSQIFLFFSMGSAFFEPCRGKFTACLVFFSFYFLVAWFLCVHIVFPCEIPSILSHVIVLKIKSQLINKFFSMCLR